MSETNTIQPEEPHISISKMCEFFHGFEVLQMQSKSTNEYIFGLYSSGNLHGHIYFGKLYSEAEILKVKRKIFPPTLADLPEYENSKTGIKYYLHPIAEYQWLSFNEGYKKIE